MLLEASESQLVLVDYHRTSSYPSSMKVSRCCPTPSSWPRWPSCWMCRSGAQSEPFAFGCQRCRTPVLCKGHMEDVCRGWIWVDGCAPAVSSWAAIHAACPSICKSPQEQAPERNMVVIAGCRNPCLPAADGAGSCWKKSLTSGW